MLDDYSVTGKKASGESLACAVRQIEHQEGFVVDNSTSFGKFGVSQTCVLLSTF